MSALAERTRVLAVAALLAGCGAGDEQTDSGGGDAPDTGAGADAPQAADADGSETGPTTRCLQDLEVGTIVTLAEDLEGGSEGLAFGPDGLLYLTSDGALWRVDPTGARTRVADTPGAAGVAPAADGVYVAGLGASLSPGVTDGVVWHVALDGAVTPLTTAIDSPNFIAVGPGGDLLVSDDFDTRVWRVTPGGSTRVQLSSVGSPNGMAFSADGRTLFVASTFTPRGEVTAFPTGPDGYPEDGSGDVLAELGGNATPDGVALDIDGRLYVAANLQSRIVRIDPESRAVADVATGLNTPASLAFGAGPGFDPCSIYVTSLFSPRLYRVVVGVEGQPVATP